MAKESAPTDSSGKSTGRRGRVENLKPWKPGQSGNPGGRAKKPVTEAYEALMREKVPGDRQGRTYAELLALSVVQNAIKGKIQAAVEVTDRVEGKAKQGIELGGPGGGAIPVDVGDPAKNEAAIAALLAKAGVTIGRSKRTRS